MTSTCPSCGGSCYRGPNSDEPCEDCGATGVIVHEPADHLVRTPCLACTNGNTVDIDGYATICPVCHGTGKVDGIPGLTF